MLDLLGLIRLFQEFVYLAPQRIGTHNDDFLEMMIGGIES